MDIPRIIHHMWLDKKIVNNTSCPKSYRFASNVAAVQKYAQLNNFEYRFWNVEKIQPLLVDQVKNFLTNPKMSWIEKCDLVRYLVMYEYGGIYLDLDMAIAGCLDKEINYWNSWSSSKHKLLFVRDFFNCSTKNIFAMLANRNHKYPTLMNGIIMSTAKNGFWLDLVKQIMVDWKPEELPVTSTGPEKMSSFLYKQADLFNSQLIVAYNYNNHLFKNLDHSGGTTWGKDPKMLVTYLKHFFVAKLDERTT